MTACQELFTSSGLEGVRLQEAVEERFGKGECEAVTVSPHSPGPVEDSEVLTRLVFHPIHAHPDTGLPVAMAFNDAWTSDLSVFREVLATDAEISLAVEQMKATGAKKAQPQLRRVIAVMMVDVAVVRSQILESEKHRAFRVYDTAEQEKPHHASVFLTKAARTQLTEKSTRKRLFEMFTGTTANYRRGLVTQPVAS